MRFKFKYEDLRSLSLVLEEGHWFFACDLKSGYYYLDICLEHQTYLVFSWRLNGVPRCFASAVLPFGLSSTCFCFTKLLRPLVKRSRSMSHSSFVHLVIDLVCHLNSCSGRGTLIIPEWPSASFWPFLREGLLSLSRLSLMCLSCLQLPIYCWRRPVRGRYMRLGFCFSRLPEVQNAGFELRF